MRKSFLLIITLFVCLSKLAAAPVKYDKKSDEAPSAFFEREYSEYWKTIPEYQQFAIACSSNIFERDGMFHLDYSNRTVFDENTSTGEKILNEYWKIFDSEDLMNNYEELTRGEQNADYKELKQLLQKYPELSIIEIGNKEELTVTQVSRLYFVQAMQELLGVHDLEAWIDARRISILRWGISAGYISYEEADALIKPIAQKIKDDYKSFEDFIAHWMAGYCYNEVYSSTCPDCTKTLIRAVETARAYIPFEKLAFTGRNADKNHNMTLDEGVYTPSELAAKMIPVQKVYKRYFNDDANVSILQELIKAEEEYPEASDITFTCHLVLMRAFSATQERIQYIESKMDYIQGLPRSSENKRYAYIVYFSDLTKAYEVEKVISLYKQLPQEFQTDFDIYFNYGYANYLMSNICPTVLERDIYISRAKTVFKQLKSYGYSIGDFLDSWLEKMDLL